MPTSRAATRRPLTSISSLVQMLQRRDGDDYSREKLALVSGQLQRIQTTLRELVNFGRPASTVRTRVSIADILDEALNIAKYYKGMKRRQIRKQLPPDLPLLLGVRDQLVQAFLNLVLNAIDATDKEGQIELTAEQQQGELHVTVRDDGVGIAPQHSGKLFQPYFTTKKNGTGLGLFVTRKLIEDNSGAVEFECTVRAIPARRGPAREVTRCYEETPASQGRRAEFAQRMKLAAALGPRPEQRPGKHDRQLLRRLRGRV